MKNTELQFINVKTKKLTREPENTTIFTTTLHLEKYLDKNFSETQQEIEASVKSFLQRVKQGESLMDKNDAISIKINLDTNEIDDLGNYILNSFIRVLLGENNETEIKGFEIFEDKEKYVGPYATLFDIFNKKSTYESFKAVVVNSDGLVISELGARDV